MNNKKQKTSCEANKQFVGGNCIENKSTAVKTEDMTSSDSNNPSEESQTSTHNTTNMIVEHFFANASQGGAEEQFLGGGNCGKGNATPNAGGYRFCRSNNNRTKLNYENQIFQLI